MSVRSALLPLVLWSSSAFAAPLELGTVRLTDRTDRDVLVTAPCSGSDNAPVSKLMLKVTAHPAEIDKLVLKFGDGSTQELLLRERFDAGSQSRWIDLDGPARCVAEIRVVGDADTIRRTPNRDARVTFWGDAVAASPDAGEGHLLGRLALSDRPDRDVLDLPACPTGGNRPVTELAVAVSGHRVEVDRLRVVFENGDEVLVPLGEVYAPGQRSAWKSLPGDARCIDAITVVGDAQSVGFRPGEPGVLSFYGR